MKKTEEKFNFWKGSKISGFFQLTKEELILKFKEWLPSKNLEWHNYYDINDCISSFISEGLHSIGNTANKFSEYRQMEKILNPIRNEYINHLEKIINSK